MSEIPTADWTWINAAADRFERAWKAGTRPKTKNAELRQFWAEAAELLGQFGPEAFVPIDQ
jgi:hypothetical protein